MDGDRLSGLLLFALALYIGYEASKLPIGSVNQPDSGFFPMGIALALLVLSALIFLETCASEHVAEPVRFGERAGRVWISVAALIVYALILNRLGYLVSTLLAMLLLLKGVEQLRWRTTLWAAFPAVIASYFLFRWLGVPLPRGILPL